MAREGDEQQAVEAEGRGAEGGATAPAAAADGAAAESAPADEEAVTITVDYEAVLRDKEKELAELQDRYLRLAADFDNFKKRTIKERAELVKFQNESLGKQLLDVVDNLERARVHAETADKESLLQGVGLVENIFLQTLEKFGIRRFSALGQPFDPAFHEAVQEVPAANVPVGSVLFELQKGYSYHERLLRPARVVLCKGPPAVEEAASAEDASAGDEGQPES